MKFQHIFCTTALSIAVAAGSSAAFATYHNEEINPVDIVGGYDKDVSEVEGHADAEKKSEKMATDKSGAANTAKKHGDDTVDYDHSGVEKARIKALDNEVPNPATRVVPGAPKEGLNEELNPQAGEDLFVE